MSTFYTILIDLGVLGLFGLLYYWLQRRRILKASTFEVRDRIQEFLYELHSFLEENKGASFYQELDSFAVQLEEAANSDDLGKMSLVISNKPQELPEDLGKELSSISELF